MNLNLEGKHALVCGSSQGIGLAIAQELALLGANCTLMARNAQTLEEAMHTLHKGEGQHHNVLVADFSKNENVQTAIINLVEMQPVDILINNTGGPPAGQISAAKADEFLSAYHLHLVNNHQLAMACLPHMKAQNFGRIINVISTSVKVPLPNLGVSNTTRAAVAAWAKTLSNEVAQFGVTVNNVLPGATNTVRLTNIISGKATKTNSSVDDVSKEMLHEIPMRRFGDAKEIAAVAAFLASPAAAYVTGQSVCVDGGRTGSI
jgi:3-oxoacyl-[acyl-carrier protein] reductase